MWFVETIKADGIQHVALGPGVFSRQHSWDVVDVHLVMPMLASALALRLKAARLCIGAASASWSLK